VRVDERVRAIAHRDPARPRECEGERRTRGATRSQRRGAASRSKGGQYARRRPAVDRVAPPSSSPAIPRVGSARAHTADARRPAGRFPRWQPWLHPPTTWPTSRSRRMAYRDRALVTPAGPLPLVARPAAGRRGGRMIRPAPRGGRGSERAGSPSAVASGSPRRAIRAGARGAAEGRRRDQPRDPEGAIRHERPRPPSAVSTVAEGAPCHPRPAAMLRSDGGRPPRRSRAREG
jgi:hypothetical protein